MDALATWREVLLHLVHAIIYRLVVVCVPVQLRVSFTLDLPCIDLCVFPCTVRFLCMPPALA